jgi:hypothetical protein
MRWFRVLLAGLLAVAALLLPGAAAADQRQHLGLHDMTCTGITAMGEGMPKQATLSLTLVDRSTGATLARQTVRTSAMGMFRVHLAARLNQVLNIRLLVRRHDGGEVGFADHVMAMGAAMCNLPFTGPRSGSLLGVGGGCLLLGVALLRLGARRPPQRG